MLFLEATERFNTTVARVYIEHDNIRYQTGRNPYVGIWPFSPPAANFCLVGARILDAVLGPRMFPDALAIWVSARAN